MRLVHREKDSCLSCGIWTPDNVHEGNLRQPANTGTGQLLLTAERNSVCNFTVCVEKPLSDVSVKLCAVNGSRIVQQDVEWWPVLTTATN